jgi:hypothetical protein
VDLPSVSIVGSHLRNGLVANKARFIGLLRAQDRGEGGPPGYPAIKRMAIRQSRTTDFLERGWGIEEKGTFSLYNIGFILFL